MQSGHMCDAMNQSTHFKIHSVSTNSYHSGQGVNIKLFPRPNVFPKRLEAFDVYSSRGRKHKILDPKILFFVFGYRELRCSVHKVGGLLRHHLESVRRITTYAVYANRLLEIKIVSQPGVVIDANDPAEEALMRWCWALVHSSPPDEVEQGITKLEGNNQCPTPTTRCKRGKSYIYWVLGIIALIDQPPIWCHDGTLKKTDQSCSNPTAISPRAVAVILILIPITRSAKWKQ
ncbi:hypothetical protein L2E82_12477 [Cichorium intybus]|uniref:Uncharacterized protein n=1 Tax=Cichorium intybus TaxID=13427 RepID=A0ACB9GG67_CICIN|nr:hypothetical protein L2E82_12477 [Cichorium intybus]